ncbi:hypothetical protein OROHE_006069 [Orobanche hederae]
MVRGVRKKQVRSVAECSSRRKKYTGKSKMLKSRKKPVDHDMETASETDFDVNKDVGRRQSMKKRPRDTPFESSENESMSMDKGDANRKHHKKHPRQFDTETSESCHGSSDRSSDSGYSSKNDPDIINEVLNASSTDYSSDGCDKKCRGMMKPRNNFGVTYYRSNLKTAINDISKLKFIEAHLERIKRTPIWFFFDAIYRKGGRKLMQKTDKVDRDIRRLIKNFDNRKSRFIIGGEVVPLTCQDVSLIFGVTGGKLIIHVKNKRGHIVPWMRRHFGDEIEKKTSSFDLSKTRLLHKLEKLSLGKDETSIVDIARFVHCFLMASVLTPCQNSSVAWPVTEIVEDFDEVEEYNWCQYIIDVLWKQMKMSLNMKLGGCAILLPYWLCEHTQLVKPSGEDLFLRFMKWDLQELKSSFANVKLFKINPKKLKLENLKPTRDEKRLFMSLVDEIADSRRDLSETEGCGDELSGEAKTQTASRGVSCLEHNSGGSDPLWVNDEHNSGGSDPLGVNDEHHSGGSDPVGVNDGLEIKTLNRENCDNGSKQAADSTTRKTNPDIASTTQLEGMKGPYSSADVDPRDSSILNDVAMCLQFDIPFFSLNFTQATTTPNCDVQKVICNVIDDLSKDDFDMADENNRDKITSLEDVFSKIHAYNSRQPDVCSEIGVSSFNNTIHNQTLGGRNLLMELERLRQKNKELIEKIDRMNKEREIKRSVHEQYEGQFARLNVEDNRLKDFSDQDNSTVVLVDV